MRPQNQESDMPAVEKSVGISIRLISSPIHKRPRLEVHSPRQVWITFQEISRNSTTKYFTITHDNEHQNWYQHQKEPQAQHQVGYGKLVNGGSGQLINNIDDNKKVNNIKNNNNKYQQQQNWSMEAVGNRSDVTGGGASWTHLVQYNAMMCNGVTLGRCNDIQWDRSNGNLMHKGSCSIMNVIQCNWNPMQQTAIRTASQADSWLS